MKSNNGKILILFGLLHALFGISPAAFGEQFLGFSKKYFFKISEGLWEFPLLSGQMNYEDFAAFWFFYFGLLLIPLGFLLHYVENLNLPIPRDFIGSYLVVVLIGVFMIPFSGMTFILLPHAVYMFVQNKKQGKNSVDFGKGT